MPDHIHMILLPTKFEPEDLKKWVPRFKSQITKSWPDKPTDKIWQPHFWDTRIRNDSHYAEIVDYMHQNPVAKNLASNPTDWPYQGGLA